MGLAVGHIVKLVGPDGAHGLGEAARIFHVVVGVLVGDGGHFDEFGAQLADGVLLLLALGHGDDDHGAEAHGPGHDSQADAGISGGSFDDGAAGLQVALGDGIPDDEQGGAVFHRLAGIHELGLAQNGAAREFRGLSQADEGGIADGGNDVVLDIHGKLRALP